MQNVLSIVVIAHSDERYSKSPNLLYHIYKLVYCAPWKPQIYIVKCGVYRGTQYSLILAENT